MSIFISTESALDFNFIGTFWHAVSLLASSCPRLILHLQSSYAVCVLLVSCSASVELCDHESSLLADWVVVFKLTPSSLVFFHPDDLDIAGDFFEYMTAGERLMVKDKSIWCVSAWNDNGKPDFIDEAKPEILYRTDFFPGLGWMLKKDVWAELSGKWPRAFWDDWMRNPAQRKDRACIRPEISRTFTFGQRGASQGQYWTQHLQFIKMNKVDVEFTSMNLDYLLKDNYDKSFKEAVYAAPETSLSSIPVSGATSVRVTYANNVDFTRIAKQFRLMDDLRVSGFSCPVCVCGKCLHFLPV